MAWYFVFLVAFMLLAIAPWLSAALVVGYFAIKLVEHRQNAGRHQALSNQKIQDDQAKAATAARLLDDAEYARAKFFENFLRFSPLGYHDEGIELLEQIRPLITVPVIYTESIETGPNAFVPTKQTYRVLTGKDQHGAVVAERREVSERLDAGATEEGVPQEHSLGKSEEILRLRDGRRIRVTTSFWHVAKGGSGGNVEYRWLT